MEIIRKVFGELANNVYIVYDAEALEGYVIDPGYEAKKLAALIRRRQLNIKGILLTHYHFDHTDAAVELSRLLGETEIRIHSLDVKYIKKNFYRRMKDGDIFSFGKESLQVLHTPGHSPGSICLLDYKGKNAFTGDTVFPTDTGYVSFKGGSPEKMMASIQRLDPILDNDWMILPGHEDIINMQYVRKHNREYQLYLKGVLPADWPPELQQPQI